MVGGQCLDCRAQIFHERSCRLSEVMTVDQSALSKTASPSSMPLCTFPVYSHFSGQVLVPTSTTRCFAIPSGIAHPFRLQFHQLVHSLYVAV
jgi:hypothetical protein